MEECRRVVGRARQTYGLSFQRSRRLYARVITERSQFVQVAFELMRPRCRKVNNTAQRGHNVDGGLHCHAGPIGSQGEFRLEQMRTGWEAQSSSLAFKGW